MIVRSAAPVSFLVQFLTGHPDGDISWQLFSPAGAVLDSGTITPDPDAVSVFVTVPGTSNTLGVGELSSYRDLQWTYEVNGEAVFDERRYIVEARLPLGVSAEGVRAKLGVDNVDLPDSEISLVAAYYEFQNQVTEAVLDAFVTANPVSIPVRDAIEAMAAISLIPSMVVRIAQKETSGTNAFQRQKVDWELLGSQLASLVVAGYTLLVPSYAATGGFGDLFLVVSPANDPFTGA